MPLTENKDLLAITTTIAKARNKTDLSSLITTQLKSLIPYSGASIIILDKEKQKYSFFIWDLPGCKTKQANYSPQESSAYSVEDGICNVILKAKIPIIFNCEKIFSQPESSAWLFLKKNGIKEIMGVALREGEEILGAFCLFFKSSNISKKIDLLLIQGVACQITAALTIIIAKQIIEKQQEEINAYKNQLEEGNLYLQAAIAESFNNSEIIGSGPEMQKVFNLLSQVSFTASTVLILGETGTGKELIARAIHQASSRKDKSMIKINCAALPPNLIESELFGHERGSFTGAIDRRIGKFELANHSTLFLDEIGELPLDLQAKLLRALQEKEIERIGGKNPVKTNVRIIAATNRDLRKEVDEGKFRSDLYYRLNVFPITMPPLRSRREDIPALATYFLARYARNNGKTITNISHKALQKLTSYHWPGNVRELEHFIEKSVLLATSSIIKDVHLPIRNQKSIISTTEERIKTLDENERDHILAVLKMVRGRVSGTGGAAELLGVPYSTLNSKIKKLGIKKAHFVVK